MEEFFELLLKQLVSVVVGGVCAYLGTRLRAKKAELAAKEEADQLYSQAICVMLRNTIRQACKRRIEKDGWVALDEKDDILSCYDVYEKIIKRSGMSNGVIDDCIRQYRSLPNVPPKEEIK